MSDIFRGIKIAFAAALSGYLIWTFAPGMSEPEFKPEQVACFPMPSTAGLMPDVKSEMMQAEGAPTVLEQKRQSMKTYQAAVRDAAAGCTIESCDPADRRKYRSAIFFYILTRESITRNLYRERADSGLAYAEEIFNTIGDIEVIDHFQAMVRAGKFDLGTLGKAKGSAALLALKPESAYLPCPDEDKSPASGKAPEIDAKG